MTPTSLFLQVLDNNTLTENGAPSYRSSGSAGLDYFFRLGMLQGRNPADVATDMRQIWNEDPSLALAIMFYTRAVTRKSRGFFEASSIQKGQGRKDEFIKQMAWLEAEHPDILYQNLWLVPEVGSWKDLWYDSPATNYFYYVDTARVYPLVAKGITNDTHRGLIAKYLPRIRSKSNTKNDRHRRLNEWAKGFCNFMGWTQRDYQKFKSSPDHTAHLWQRHMSAGWWSDIDFSRIPGRALNMLVNQRGRDKLTVLQRHDLEHKFVEWLKTQPTAKFTGYPHELTKQVWQRNPNVVQSLTIDKQFAHLLEMGKSKDKALWAGKNVLCAVDTSGSMEWSHGMDVRPIDVCLSLGLYFANLNTGLFNRRLIGFDANPWWISLKSDSFVGQMKELEKMRTAWGNTDFNGIIRLIVDFMTSAPRKIEREEMPHTILVVSDMQFDPTGNHGSAPALWGGRKEAVKIGKTNHEVAMEMLEEVGLGDMEFIWWNVSTRGRDVPGTKDMKGVTLISGFDPAILSSILDGQEKAKREEGKQLTPMENMLIALDQEYIRQIKM